MGKITTKILEPGGQVWRLNDQLREELGKGTSSKAFPKWAGAALARMRRPILFFPVSFVNLSLFILKPCSIFEAFHAKCFRKAADLLPDQRKDFVSMRRCGAASGLNEKVSLCTTTLHARNKSGFVG